MYSTHNKGKSIIAEQFIRTLKNKIYKYKTLISRYIRNILIFQNIKTYQVYIRKLDDIVNKNDNTYHRITKMKPVDVKQSTYIDSSKEFNNEDTEFKIVDIVRISKYRNIFAKCSNLVWRSFCD